MKFAAIARDMPVKLSTGELVDQRMPWQKNRPLIMWVVGIQLNHIGATIHRLLFQEGLYKTIRDPKTRKWRQYKPWSLQDRLNEKEVRPSKPLIPSDGLKWDWERRAGNEFNLCELPDGTKIYAWGSNSNVKQGDPVDVIWIDEAIMYASHYPEWQARLSDTKGRIFWSSWPTNANPALMDLSRRAAEQSREVELGERGKADVEEVVLRFSDNPHIDSEEKRKRIEGWSEDERRARDLGEFTTDSFLIYPQFSKQIHAAVYDDPEMDDDISRILRERNGQPPSDWTRELILDPGTSRPAVLLCAVPPPKLGDYLVVYDEIYERRLDADKLAKRVYQKTKGYFFERFIIDGRAGRQTAMGFGKTVQSNYSRAFAELELKSRQTGSQFVPGSDDELARIQHVQSMMTVRSNGRPRLRIHLRNCQRLVEQLESNVKAMEGLEIAEKPAKGQKDDLRVCLEYWISRTPRYVQPPTKEETGSPAYQYWKKWKALRDGRNSDGSVHFGPGKVGA